MKADLGWAHSACTTSSKRDVILYTPAVVGSSPCSVSKMQTYFLVETSADQPHDNLVESRAAKQCVFEGRCRVHQT